MAPPWTIFLSVVTLHILIHGSEQLPQNVVFQPVTYQLISPEDAKESSDVVYAKVNAIPRTDDTAGSLVCKQLLPQDPLAKALTPTIQPASPLVYFPSVELPSFIKDPAMGRYYPSLVSPDAWGIIQNDPVASYLPAPPPPLIAAVCVTSENPRPFPVLFSPPVPHSSLKSGEAFENPAMVASLKSSPSVNHASEDNIKLDLHLPAAQGLTLGLNGVPATIQRSASKDNPAGVVLVKLHANPSGSITLGIPTDARSDLLQGERSTPVSTISRGDGTSSVSPAVSLVFSSPVGSIGIGSSNTPAVNIERQSIVSNPTPNSESSIRHFMF